MTLAVSCCGNLSHQFIIALSRRLRGNGAGGGETVGVRNRRKYEHQPYLTCWCPLDDVNEENGTVYILSYSLAGTRDYVPHVLDPETNDKVGYFGDEPGIPVIVPAGSIVCFRSTVLHRTGYNHTDKMRRVFLMQYSPEAILNREGTAPRHLAEPFLEDGRRVGENSRPSAS